ncbi:MAG: hypothetical protein IT562_18300 [Alphaproteobacteria bacterium]|nr:hypothetical protein [Alphaproteobacteria bacterium]
MSSHRFHTQGFFELAGPAEPAFLSRVLQVLAIRGCIVGSVACTRRGGLFVVNLAIDEHENWRPDVVAALLRRIIGLESLRWHVEARRDRAAVPA